ncbi:MAG TPA: type II toxin-antitoxin system RelE/ParE family toxin [Firmicutes bacterium]|jgi:toxin ParE1/3/4|nr:type II toxin-antitoxin system RelE/ParE family toxin [Bacillota bacterium]HBK59344.1 type II toxin-antitoxin system RelE/ParE family toxin [Bacillota bacterium]
MTSEYAVYMTSSAHRDLAEIVQYIAGELAEPITAAKQVDRLESAIASLAVMPSRTSPVADERLRAMGVRKLLVDNYLVFYVVSECAAAVTVLRILHARRDWEDLL